MTQVILPKLNQTGANEWADVQDNDVAIREVVNGGLDNDNLTGSAGITAANLAGEIPKSKLATDAKSAFTWYTPKATATEETRTNAAFGTLTTADEIKEIVVPENGQLLVGFSANVKSSVSAAGRVAIFVGSNQLKSISSSSGFVVQEASTSGTSFNLVSSATVGLISSSGGEAFPTTGVVLGEDDALAGWVTIHRLPAATYTISVRYKSSTGSVTAKERLTMAAVWGA